MEQQKESVWMRIKNILSITGFFIARLLLGQEFFEEEMKNDQQNKKIEENESFFEKNLKKEEEKPIQKEKTSFQPPERKAFTVKLRDLEKYPYSFNDLMKGRTNEDVISIEDIASIAEKEIQKEFNPDIYNINVSVVNGNKNSYLNVEFYKEGNFANAVSFDENGNYNTSDSPEQKALAEQVSNILQQVCIKNNISLVPEYQNFIDETIEHAAYAISTNHSVSLKYFNNTNVVIEPASNSDNFKLTVNGEKLYEGTYYTFMNPEASENSYIDLVKCSAEQCPNIEIEYPEVTYLPDEHDNGLFYYDPVAEAEREQQDCMNRYIEEIMYDEMEY
jgi:hypothetical protein